MLLERADRIGGLARTEICHGGFHFDCTGHWLHLRDPEIRQLVDTEWLPGGLTTIARRAAIHSRGVFTPFPYQVNTYGLPKEVVAENLLGFIEAQVGEFNKDCLNDKSIATSKDEVLEAYKKLFEHGKKNGQIVGVSFDQHLAPCSGNGQDPT